MSVTYAPTFKTVRNVTSVDEISTLTKRNGLNLADFEEVILIVTLHGTLTQCTVRPYFWSDAANKFVQSEQVDLISTTAVGILKKINTYRHKSVFFAVTEMFGSGECKIEVAGVPSYDKVG